MATSIRDIVIVGGGTAGWLAAVYLNRALGQGDRPACNVTLVESSDIGTVGVGESTLPTLRLTLQTCDIDETEFLLGCNASFKMGIRFVGWSGRPGHEVFYHPFGTVPTVRRLAVSHFWHRRYLAGERRPFAEVCFPILPALEARRAPKVLGDEPFAGAWIYAYHVDAGLLAGYLKELGKARGVRHVVDNVVEVKRRPDGAISHLVTERSGELHGELFVDCSGFGGLLINKTLGEPFESYAPYLFCDRAIAIPVEYPDDQGPVDSYTTATALSAGWAWKVPLYNRTGNGYVYSSAGLSPDEAEAELRRHLGAAADGSPARHLAMRVGRTRNAWVKNCVSLGLAGGFIEPLEATSIALIELGLANLVNNFPSAELEPGLIRKYNATMQRYYEAIRDFIILHYCTTAREDTPFWRANKHHAALPDSLKARLELFEAMLPDHDELDLPPMYGDVSYSAILAGMGYLPKRPLPILAYWDEAEADARLREVVERGARLREILPDHRKYLNLLRDESWPRVLEYLRARVAAAAPAIASSD